MREKRFDEVYHEMSDEDEIARFVKQGLSRAVAEERGRLEGLERRVTQALEGRRKRRRIARPGLPPAGLRPAWALAATAAVFLLGLYVGAWLSNPLPQQGVTFALYDPTAQNVSLAIGYPVEGHSEWEPVPMQKRDGFWYLSLRLPPGTYEYGFKIDGRWWADDPAADYWVMSANNTVNAVREVTVAGDQI